MSQYRLLDYKTQVFRLQAGLKPVGGGCGILGWLRGFSVRMVKDASVKTLGIDNHDNHVQQPTKNQKLVRQYVHYLAHTSALLHIITKSPTVISLAGLL